MGIRPDRPSLGADVKEGLRYVLGHPFPRTLALGGLLVPFTGAGARLAWYVAGSLLIEASVTAFNVCVRSAVQIGTPPELLGRTTASIRLFSRSALPLAALVAGALASALTARVTLAVRMGLLVVTPLLLRFSPLGRVRRTEQLAPVSA